MNHCQNCGTEIQGDWCYCAYCVHLFMPKKRDLLNDVLTMFMIVSGAAIFAVGAKIVFGVL